MSEMVNVQNKYPIKFKTSFLYRVILAVSGVLGEALRSSEERYAAARQDYFHRQ